MFPACVRDILGGLDYLLRADMWSLGLVMNAMINPDLGSPYRPELEGCGDPNMALKDLMRRRQLPQYSAKYEQLRITSWRQIDYIFNQCANFDAMARSTTAQMLSFINKGLVNFFCRFPFPISPSTALEQCDARLAASLQDSMSPSTSQCTSLPLNYATNCCSFLSLGIFDRLFHDTGFNEQP